jgi:hypothetical protein
MQACEPSRFIAEIGEDIKHSGKEVTKELGNARLAMLKSALGGTT